MSSQTIVDVLRRECGFGLEVPEGNGWIRLEECPSCYRSGGTANRGGRRCPAVINHDIGFFICHACGVRRSATFDTSAASRFSEVVRMAAYIAWRKFPGVLTVDEARSYAYLRLMVFAGPDDGSCADAGALERWEKATADMEQPEAALDRYVMQALNGDLTNYGCKLVRDKGRETPLGTGESGPEDDEESDWRSTYLAGLLDSKSFEDWDHMKRSGQFSQSDYPVLYATKLDGMTRDEVKAALGWTERELRERLSDEKQRLAQAFYLGRQGSS